MKKVFGILAVGAAVATLASCGEETVEATVWDGASIKANWTAMIGGDDGDYGIPQENITVNENGSVTVKNEPGEWQGIRSPKISLDLTGKDSVFGFKVLDNKNDQVCKWGAKFFPADPAIDDHAWGWYVIPDTVQHWGTTVSKTTDGVFDGLDGIEAMKAVYGDNIEGYIDIFVVGSISETDGDGNPVTVGCEITFDEVSFLPSAYDIKA